MKKFTPAMLLAAAMGRSIVDAMPEGIERSEKIGQMDLVASTKMPKEMRPDRQAYEKLGFTFGEDVDDIFVAATLPEGWTRQATDHSMWSAILDDKGRTRVSVFYKAAFYDRSATAHLELRFVARWVHKDSSGETLQQDEEAFVVIDSSDGSVIFRTPTFMHDKTYETYRASQTLAENWLKENYPDHADPTAYWEYSMTWFEEKDAPEGKWLRTKREGEAGENVCRLIIWPDGEREWVEQFGGRTTVTHHSFAPPTHWQPL